MSANSFRAWSERIVLDYGQDQTPCSSPERQAEPALSRRFVRYARRATPARAGGEPLRSAMGLLAGIRVLVVEDDPVMGIDITEVIEEADGKVVGPVKSIK